MMEGINKTLFEVFKERNNGEITKKIEKFLSLAADDYEERQRLALSISSDILYRHSKEDLPKIAVSLAKLEKNLQEIQPYQRDHVCHALLTFLLGYFVILKLNLHEKLDNFLFQWKLAALLHDVGYPLEITDNINQKYFEYYERNVLNEKFEFYPTGGNYLLKYLSLYVTDESQDRNTLDITNKRLVEWGISLNTEEIFCKMIEGQKFDNGDKRTDHGITSAILVMRAIDKKYEEKNPDQSYNEYDGWSFGNMEKQITNVCSAIFIHNLELSELFWDFKKTPLATLLKVCDELQEWGRPMADDTKVEASTDYDIQFEGNNIIFYVKDKIKLDNMKTKLENISNFPYKLKKLN